MSRIAQENANGGPAISLQLIGANVEQVARASRELERRIRGYAGVYDIRNSYERGRPEVKLNIKPEAESLGLSLRDLASQVRAGFYGQEVQRIQRGQDEVKVMVRYPREERDSVGYLDNMRIRTPDGGRVPFNAVAEVEIGENCHIKRAIIDRGAVVEDGTVIGEDHDADRERGYRVTSTGLTLVTPDMLGQHLHFTR